MEERQRRQARRDVQRMPETSDLLAEMDRAGVDAAVIVPPMLNQPEPQNEPSIRAAREHPERFVVMGRIPLRKRDAMPLLDAWTSIPEVKGIRVNFGLPSARLDDPNLSWLWKAAEERALPIALYGPDQDPTLVGEIARVHPSLRLIIDHLWLGAYKMQDDLLPTVRRLFGLARFDNIAVKASALPAVTPESYPFPRLQRCLREAIDAFGAGRVFWGSDISRLPCRYEQLVALFSQHLNFLSDEQRCDVLGDALLRWIDWSPQPDSASAC